MAPTLRFDGAARYGAAIVLMMFGVYLGVATDFSAIVQSESFAGTIATDIPFLNAAQFLLVLGAILTAIVLLPTSGWRRLGAFTLAAVVLLLWATFGLQRAGGNLVEPADVWRFVLNQAMVMLIAGVGGWLIARGRHPLSWIVLVLAVIPALVTPVMTQHSFPSGAIALITQAMTAVIGFGAVWLAAVIDRAQGGRTQAGADAGASAPASDAQSSSVR